MIEILAIRTMFKKIKNQIFSLFFSNYSMFNFGILGMNARNLQYIKKQNPRKAVRLADNKLQTKKFLGERGIPFAETYAVIRSRKQLVNFDFSTLPAKNFVLKPNHGSKGRGVCILKKL